MNRDLFDLRECSWRGICMDLLRNCWMILLTILTIWMGMTGVSKLINAPQYTASSTLVVSVNGNQDPYSSLSVTTQMAEVFRGVFQSEALRNLIAEEMGRSVSASVSCSQVEETNLLNLDVTAENPRDAYLFIRSALKNYQEVAGQVFANASLIVLQEPTVPEQPSGQPKLIRYRSILALAGGAGMAAVIVLFYFLRFTVKTVVSAENQLDGNVCGTIPFDGRKQIPGQKKEKKALLLTSPLVSMSYAEATRRTAGHIEYAMRKKRNQIILVTSVSENEGKSTVAANLALALAEKHKKVLLVDGDLRKPAQFKVFDKKGKKRVSLDQVLRGEISWKEAVVWNRQKRIMELFQYRALRKPDELLSVGTLRPLAAEWRASSDYVIIDCSPTSVSAEAEQWMQIADTAVLVVRQDWSDVRVINDTVDMIWQGCGDFTGFVLNAFQEEWFRETGAQSYKEYSRG